MTNVLPFVQHKMSAIIKEKEDKVEGRRLFIFVCCRSFRQCSAVKSIFFEISENLFFILRKDCLEK